MRIISGKLKGRRIKPPANTWPTRPTTDFAKEGLYNILQHRMDFTDLRVLDLFGGAGNHSFEWVSRGAGSVTYVDRHPPCCRFVEETARAWEVQDVLTVRNMDVLAFIRLRQEPYDFIFAGPPYAMPQIEALPDLILGAGLLAEEGLLVLEHDPSHRFQQHPRFLELRTYGKTHFSFFQ
jgi:16S rRNA (guanine966-N2)-methyltransferase